MHSYFPIPLPFQVRSEMQCNLFQVEEGLVPLAARERECLAGSCAFTSSSSAAVAASSSSSSTAN